MNDQRPFVAQRAWTHTAMTRRMAAVSMVMLLTWGCRGTLPSAPPTTGPVATATAGAAAATPGPTPTPPDATATPRPSAKPPAEHASWVDAGELTLAWDVTLVPLADGGAVALGAMYQGDEIQPAAARLAPGTTAWDPIEPLNKLRSKFGATLLQDGRVLVAGGLNNQDQSYSSAYTFDPQRPADGWTKVGLLGSARTAPSMAVLPDGRVLVAGGYFHTGEEAGTGIADRHYASGRATPPWETTPTRRGPRLDDVDVPPYGYALATAELFDPRTGEWTATGSLNFARAGAPAVTLADGRVLVVGSRENVRYDLPGKAHGSAEIFDPATGTFALAAALPAPDEQELLDLGVDMRDTYLDLGHPGQPVALPDGGALLVGRSHWAKHHADVLESFRLDPTSQSWRSSGTPCAAVGYNDEAGARRTEPPCLIGGFVAPLDGDRVLSAGVGSWSEWPGESRTAAIYDPNVDRWLEQPSLPFEYEGGGGAIGLADGTALVVGSARDGNAMVALRFIPPR